MQNMFFSFIPEGTSLIVLKENHCNKFSKCEQRDVQIKTKVQCFIIKRLKCHIPIEDIGLYFQIPVLCCREKENM